MTNIQEIFDHKYWLSPQGGPRYIQLQQRLEKAIRSGQMLPGTPLPPEREIAKMTTLSRVTVRKAMQQLVRAGLVKQRRGSGTVVSSNIAKVEQSLSLLTSFSEDMSRRGFDVSSIWLERGIFHPSPEEIVALGLSSGDLVSRISRLRQAQGEPMAIERASLPTDLLPNPEKVENSLYDALEKNGNRPVRALQRISALNLGKNDAKLLGLKPGIAGLRIERTSYLSNGRVVEFTRSIYRSDAYDFVAELRVSVEGSNFE